MTARPGRRRLTLDQKPAPALVAAPSVAAGIARRATRIAKLRAAVARWERKRKTAETYLAKYTRQLRRAEKST